MKKSTLIALGIVLLTPALAYTFAPTPQAARVERGRYLVEAFACSDCHSPWVMGANGPHPDPARYLSGHPAELDMPPAPQAEGPWITSASASMTAWNGPWGMSFTANLTPDDETGLGRWSEEDFIATLRNGRHLGRGRELLPPMPFQAIRRLSDEDLGSMYAYLQSIPAISNRVPNPRPPVAH
jgi:mono/diheme cytochrome c family protein